MFCTGKDDTVALKEYAIVQCKIFSEVPVVTDGYKNLFSCVWPSHQCSALEGLHYGMLFGGFL